MPSTNLSQTDIFNMALISIGASTVSSPTDGSKNARTCLQVYDFLRMAELRKPPYWSFAIGMEALAASNTPPLFDRAYAYPLPSDYIMMADSFPETNYNDKDWIIQEGSVYTNGSYNFSTVNAQIPSNNYYTFVVTSANATAGAVYSNNSQVFTVITTISGSTSLATSGTGNASYSGTLTLITGSGDPTITYSSWTNSTTLPTYPDPGPLNIRYIQNVTDTTKFDPLFAKALAAKLAYTVCETLTQSNAKKAEANKDYADAIMDARKANAFEDVSEEFPLDTYWTARL